MSAFSAALPWGKARHAQPGETEKQRKWRIFWSYLPDWILTIFLWVSRVTQAVLVLTS